MDGSELGKLLQGLSSEDIEKAHKALLLIRDTFDIIYDLKNRGFLDNFSLDSLNSVRDFVARKMDVDMTYEQVSAFTGKKLPNIYKKVSTSIIRPKLNRRTIKYSDMIKIKEGKV